MTDTWPQLKPLDVLERPPFPVNALSKVLREYVEALAESLQVPADLPASLILTAISAALAKRFIVQVIADWAEPCNLFSVTVLPPAHRKSAIFKAVMQPIEDVEDQARRQLGPLVAQRDNEIRVLIARLKLADKAAIHADPGEQALALQEINELKAKIPSPLHLPRLIADNVTPEKLISLLAENDGRIGIFSAEGGIFNIMAGHYSKSGSGPDIDVFLKAHAGDNIRTDRMTRDSDSDSDKIVAWKTEGWKQVWNQLFILETMGSKQYRPL